MHINEHNYTKHTITTTKIHKELRLKHLSKSDCIEPARETTTEKYSIPNKLN